jgi:hypothetical protein
LIDLDPGDFGGGAEFVEGAEEGSAVLGVAGAGHDAWGEDLDGLGGDGAVFGEGLGEAAEDEEGMEVVIEPGSEFLHAYLEVFDFIDLGGDFLPFGTEEGESDLLEEEGEEGEADDGTCGEPCMDEAGGGIAGGELLEGGDAWREEFEGGRATADGPDRGGEGWAGGKAGSEFRGGLTVSWDAVDAFNGQAHGGGARGEGFGERPEAEDAEGFELGADAGGELAEGDAQFPEEDIGYGSELVAICLDGFHEGAVGDHAGSVGHEDSDMAGGGEDIDAGSG